MRELVAVFLCFALTVCGYPTAGSADRPSAAESTNNACGELFLTSRETDGGELEVELVLKGECGMSAFFGEIAYDQSKLLYLGAGGVEGELNLTAADLGECVRFLLDGTANCAKSCSLARFYFKRTGEGDTALSLSGKGVQCALFLDGDGRPQPFNVTLSGCVLSDAEDVLDITAPGVATFELCECEGGVLLCFEISSPSRCFAAGVRIFTVDLECAAYSIVYAVGVPCDGIFVGECMLYGVKKQGFSAIITPVAFDRLGELRGGKEVLVITNYD